MGEPEKEEAGPGEENADAEEDEAAPGLFSRAWGAVAGFAGRHRRILTILGAIVGLAVLIGGWRTHDYVRNDPEFCLSCHSMDEAYEEWTESRHSRVNCHACHASSLSSDLHNLWVTLVERQTEVTKHAHVPNERCTSCHVREDPEAAGPVGVGHRTHVGRAGIDCVRCHSTGIHEFVVPTESCRDCHIHTVIRSSEMEKFHCLECHSFSSQTAQAVQETAGESCRRCHVRLGVGETNFPDDPAAPHRQMACDVCHVPHREPRPTEATCLQCHESVRENEGHAYEGHASCAECHEPHTWEGPATQGCLDCHAGTHPEHVAEVEGMACLDCHDFGQ